MTGTFEQEYEEVWQLCDNCQELRVDVTYHSGKRMCSKCQS
jgi:hypothetical protein